MSHLFCHSCGTKISYGHAKPNFCGKCGQQLNQSATANVGGNVPAIEQSVVISSDETDATVVPNIVSFQVDVEQETSSVTLGSLIGEEDPPKNREKNRSRSVNEFIDEKKKER
jgi:hypothetical protein